MFTEDLFDSFLIEPFRKGNVNRLYIISGYASATFARLHLNRLTELNEDFQINLIIGMPSAKSDHIAFLKLHEDFKNKFKGYYLQEQPPVHCKAYSWCNFEEPYSGFSGSANYSQYGFFSGQQINQITDDNSTEIKSLFDKLIRRSIYIPDHKVDLPKNQVVDNTRSITNGGIVWEIPDVRVRISFLDRKGILPERSGLNWGKRLSKVVNKKTGEISWSKREPNQAYLSIKKDATKQGFLPEKAFSFSLITDDGESFDCVVAQDGRKAIHSTNDNSELGRYFRNRLGVKFGEKVTIEDLQKYGRTDYTIQKIDNETFLLDFSKPKF